MGGGIEVHGIHDVGETGERRGGHHVDVLIPVGAAHENHVVGVVFANLGDYLACILFQALPRLVHGLVENLVDDVGMLAVFLGKVAEPLLGFFRVGFVCVPVHDDVYIVLDSGFHHRFYTLLGKRGVLQIVVFNLDAHGGAYHVGVPVGGQGFHGSFIIEARPDVVPA